MSRKLNDFAYTDRRSVHAMLHGRGDGREKTYIDWQDSRVARQGEAGAATSAVKVSDDEYFAEKERALQEMKDEYEILKQLLIPRYAPVLKHFWKGVAVLATIGLAYQFWVAYAALS